MNVKLKFKYELQYRSYIYKYNSVKEGNEYKIKPF
jgi:hypothetical protein